MVNASAAMGNAAQYAMGMKGILGQTAHLTANNQNQNKLEPNSND